MSQMIDFTLPSGTQRNAWSVRSGTQEGRVKSVI